MKKSILWASPLLALALTAGSVQFTPTLRAQSQSQPPSAQQQPEQTQSRTFVGQVVQAKNGQFALLVDKNAGTGFYLDNSEKAKKFTGQKVKVTGTLNAQTKTIQISDIQPMA
jgi:hypothetical protein